MERRRRGRPPKKWSVIDRGLSHWYYKLAGWRDYETTEIRIKRNSKGQPTNRADADYFASEQYQRSLIRTSRNLTLREFLAPYFVWDKCPHVKQLITDERAPGRRYVAQQRRRLELLVFSHPIADYEIESLKPGHFEDWKADLRKHGYSGLSGEDFAKWKAGEIQGRSPLTLSLEDRETLKGNEIGSRTINAGLSALKKAFANGVHRRVIDVNPVASVSKVRERSRSRGIFTPAELRKLFIESPETAWGYDENYLKGLSWRDAWSFGFVLATTGERPSAVLLCRWEHLQDDILTFPDVKDPNKDGRQVPLIPEVVEAIKSVERRGPYIWGYSSGQPFNYTWFVKRFYHAMRTLELPPVVDGLKRTPYSLKDTLITELLDRDVSEVLVRELVGHSHTYGQRALSPAQARYKRRQVRRLREVMPEIRSILFDAGPNDQSQETREAAVLDPGNFSD